ncbi:Vacuolar protein sorting-associated protein vps5 [Coemansia aciculifera]|uniref:Vacuolar protein sorting-associated protein vps5 n=2 Tax=Coemansia TaxID=4863 RepID=A0A9W8GZ49_9FUNG|nr:Vacuolar protein sorting-associated protein vps5 [Coemansia pectinata]KAJ2863380.1 Vacuolar protein sorting-associated protein vps5 [Coemansia aciculifera]
MDDSDVFGGGFGAPRQQAFTFDTDEMNPFGDIESPWGTAPAAVETLENAHVQSSEGEDDDDEGVDDENEGSDDDDDRSLRHGTEQLRISTSHADDAQDDVTSDQDAANSSTSSGEAASGEAGASLGTNSATEGQDSKPHSASSFMTPTVQTARRVGIIKRGLRSPRVLGKQLSATSFEDPLSSAVADEELENSQVAPLAATRASVDVSSSTFSSQLAVQARQTRSLSETRPHVVYGEAHPPLPSLSQPHPYDQQLSPPLQQEQVLHARQHVEGPRSRPSTPSDRHSTTLSTPSRSSASRAYMGAHQRRRSLDPTPADQMPKFQIHVTEPVKVSDSLKSYIAYKIRTLSDAPMFRESEMVVRRRYRDFDWLIQELVARHPGIIVPAIPEKQSMGRFEDEFVEARRAGLESCLTRISEHPVLWCDDVFRLFIEADDFATKARIITENRVTAEINGTGPPLSGSGGSISGSGGGSGLFGDGWGGTKYKEKDEWFARRMQELDAVEEELRALLRALEYSQRQRRELSIAHGELGEAYLKMAGQELSKSLSNGLTDMGSLQQKLKVLQSRQGVADFAEFQLTTDEYIRLIGSVRTAFTARGRAYGLWQNSLADLMKRRKVLEGYVQHPNRASPERLSQLKAEIARAEIRTEGNRNAFDDVSLILKHEVARFDASRVRDFQAAIEAYLASLIDTQEEIVTLWEAYLVSLRNTDPAESRQLSS